MTAMKSINRHKQAYCIFAWQKYCALEKANLALRRLLQPIQVLILGSSISTVFSCKPGPPPPMAYTLSSSVTAAKLPLSSDMVAICLQQFVTSVSAYSTLCAYFSEEAVTMCQICKDKNSCLL